MPEYLTTTQVAQELKVSPAWIRVLTVRNNIQRVGRDWLFTPEDVERLRQRNKKRGRVK